MRSPLNTVSGSGQIRELTRAASRKLSFSTVDTPTLSFDMPATLQQAADIEPLVDDVLAFRDEVAVQRFRVVTRALTKEGKSVRASFTAVAYKGLLDAWEFHDGDTRSWANATEQSLIAWTIFSQGQAKPFGRLGVTRGVVPTTQVSRVLVGTAAESSSPRPEYFLTGTKRGDAIRQLAGMDQGFEWDIEPDPLDPYRALKFNVWNDGGRTAHPAGRSPLILDDGGSLLTWSHTVTPPDYGNVIRFTGAETTDENGTAKAVPIKPAWYPSSENPAGTPLEGRWERDLNNSDLSTQQAVNAAAPVAYREAHDYVPEITCALKRGRWEGPPQLWLGDQARLLITQPLVQEDGRAAFTESGSPAYLLYVDEDVRIVEVDVDVDDKNAEDVSLSLNRPKPTTKRARRQINDRLTRLERR